MVKITPDAADDPTVTPDERDARAGRWRRALPMRALTRMWQMLLKALEEVALAPNAMMAAEMAVIRLTHVADLPTPEEALRKLGDAPGPHCPAHPARLSRLPPAAPAPAPSAAAPNPRPQPNRWTGSRGLTMSWR